MIYNGRIHSVLNTRAVILQNIEADHQEVKQLLLRTLPLEMSGTLTVMSYHTNMLSQSNIGEPTISVNHNIS